MQGWRIFCFSHKKKLENKQKKLVPSIIDKNNGDHFGTHGGRAGLKTSSSSSSLVRQFLPSSLVRFSTRTTTTPLIRRREISRGRNYFIFNERAGNDSRQQQQQQQQGRGGRGRGGRSEGRKEEEEDKMWIHSMIPVVGALVYETRDKEEEEEEKEEKTTIKTDFFSSADDNIFEVTQSVGGEQYHLRHHQDGNHVREDMQNDFDAIRAATTEPPRDGMRRPTKKTSSRRQKYTNRFKRTEAKAVMKSGNVISTTNGSIQANQ